MGIPSSEINIFVFNTTNKSLKQITQGGSSFFGTWNDNKIIFYKQGLDKYKLIFYISNSKTMILPVVLKEKRLYILTFIMGYRAWKKLVERGKNEKNGLL